MRFALIKGFKIWYSFPKCPLSSVDLEANKVCNQTSVWSDRKVCWLYVGVSFYKENKWMQKKDFLKGFAFLSSHFLCSFLFKTRHRLLRGYILSWVKLHPLSLSLKSTSAPDVWRLGIPSSARHFVSTLHGYGLSLSEAGVSSSGVRASSVWAGVQTTAGGG